MIEVLIINDEMKARNVRKHYLENFVPEISRIEVVASVDAAHEMLEKYSPDIVF